MLNLTNNGSGVHHAIPFFMSLKGRYRFVPPAAQKMLRISTNRSGTGKADREDAEDMDGKKLKIKIVSVHPATKQWKVNRVFPAGN